MSVAAVDTVAGGRVWTGSRALKAGLVDRMGGLFDAIHLAQQRAGIDKAEKPAILLYPVQKSWFETLFASNSMSISERIILMLHQQFMHNIMPKQQFSSMQSFYEMLTTSGKLHILAMMPGEVVVK
jgi:protease-4